MSIYSDIQPSYKKPSYPKEINLVNKPTAINPTWRELTSFLLTDPTDNNIYWASSFNCTNFAEMLHNNAESAGIKSAFVAIQFEGSGPGHALNAFKTKDRGLVYVDCTGRTSGWPWYLYRYSIEYDKIAYVVKGKKYRIESLGQKAFDPVSWIPQGIVKSIEIYW